MSGCTEKLNPRVISDCEASLVAGFLEDNLDQFQKYLENQEFFFGDGDAVEIIFALKLAHGL